jgi:hypothetical protein
MLGVQPGALAPHGSYRVNEDITMGIQSEKAGAAWKGREFGRWRFSTPAFAGIPAFQRLT